jgi:hypothetical protein
MFTNCQLSPAVAGTWQREGETAVFTPRTGIPADTTETVMVSEGDGGGRSGKFSFTTAAYSTLRLQELLAQLGYLPMSWAPATGAAIADGSAAAQLAAAYEPPPGTFTWHSGYPGSVHSFWQEGAANTLDEGAITGFEADHGMTATPVGTFPVYEKLPFQIMQGTNPDGSHYADPVQWVSYFQGGSAVHYIARGSYGYPQSLGCVELPYTAAEEAYPYLPYGTLVTVTP